MMPPPKKAKAIERLQKLLDEVPELRKLKYDSTEFHEWRIKAEKVVNHTFGKNSDRAKEFIGRDYTVSMLLSVSPDPDPISQKNYMKALDEFESMFESMIGEIEEYWDENEQQTPPSTKGTSVMARPTKAKAIERLRKVLDEVPELREVRHDSPEFEKWSRDAEVAVKHTFGEKSSQAKEFSGALINVSHNIPRPDPIFLRPVPDSQYRAAYRRGLDSVESLLESMIEEIGEYWVEDEQQSSGTSDLRPETQPGNKKVFVVHGHDESARESVAGFLRQLKLEPIILHEQPNEGRTIIEKFERHADDVGFVVVLLTPDDVGGPAGRSKNLKPRARQNVIFELGFFLGKLGRKRVCPLVRGDVERPSDYDGVVYIPLDDAGGWQNRLIQELNTADFDVNANPATEVDPTKASPSS